MTIEPIPLNHYRLLVLGLLWVIFVQNCASCTVPTRTQTREDMQQQTQELRRTIQSACGERR